MAPKLKPETLERRKAQILKAALTCFAQKGYHQTTMDDIVQEAGLSKGGVYWHFGSKKELFLTLFESLIEDIEAGVLASTMTEVSASEKLRGMLDLLAALSTAPDFQEIAPLIIDVWAQNWRDPELNELAIDMYNRFRDPLVQVIEEGIASGEFKPVDANALAGILFAVYDGLLVQWMVDEKMVNWDVVSDTVMRAIVDGLLTRPSA